MIELLLFVPVAFVASVVCAGVRRDSVTDILRAGTRFFVILALACGLFSVFAYFLCQWISG